MVFRVVRLKGGYNHNRWLSIAKPPASHQRYVAA